MTEELKSVTGKDLLKTPAAKPCNCGKTVLINPTNGKTTCQQCPNTQLWISHFKTGLKT